MKAKINKRLVESIQPSVKPIVISDTDLPGFRCKVTPNGKRVYVFDYYWRDRTVRITLGAHGQGLTPEDARRKATALRGRLASGEDPQDKRREQEALTLREFAELYITQHAEPKKKPSSVKDDRRYLSEWILPALGRIRLSEISRADVHRLHHKMHDRPSSANRCLALLSKMFNLAEKWGYRQDGSNPVRHLDRFKERKVERFLSAAEFANCVETDRAKTSDRSRKITLERVLIEE